MIELLAFLAATIFSGVVAVDSLIRICEWWSAQPPETHSPADFYIEWALFEHARIAVAVLAVLISLLVSGVLAHARGEPLTEVAAGYALLAALTTWAVADVTPTEDAITFTPDDPEDTQE